MGGGVEGGVQSTFGVNEDVVVLLRCHVVTEVANEGDCGFYTAPMENEYTIYVFINKLKAY